MSKKEKSKYKRIEVTINTPDKEKIEKEVKKRGNYESKLVVDISFEDLMKLTVEDKPKSE